jgi:hypothetical protein
MEWLEMWPKIRPGSTALMILHYKEGRKEGGSERGREGKREKRMS